MLVESFSGIRGIYGKELTDDIALRYSFIFSDFLKKRKGSDIKIVLGRDTRKSGERLRMTVIEGLDCDIIDIGKLPTPAIENAVRAYKADGGIIITASHNEPQYNGLKFLDKDGAVLRPNDIENIIESFHKLKKVDEPTFLSKKLYKESRFEHVKHVDKMNKDALIRYKEFLQSYFSTAEKKQIRNSGIKIVIDPNGGAGIVSKEIFEDFGVNAFFINAQEGIFKRKIEPDYESLKYLSKEIKERNADFAAGFDCDADRVELILDDNSLVSGNHILALLVDELLSSLNHPEKETVVVNDATSYLVKGVVQKYKAGWQEVEVGEINVVENMLAFNSPIGGEGSNGGIIIPPSRCRDGILTVLYLIKIIAKKKKSLKELIKELPRFYYLKDKIALKKDFIEFIDKVKKYYLEKGFLIKESDKKNSLKAIKDNSWLWFRQSKTESKLLRIICDSRDELIAKQFLSDAKKIILKFM